ncbi:hypothetical protein, variant [Exophiala dermatitidis NIH/UT8656]|uniref:Uncharacterized protein n=1 Tax=Exophiala dermatitidis (strain ATCC 34100 / CBS 525.76 / NIH/UT8656) TaxID=858893 RepID=H6BST0_EXODN|nr:uncharacterized protein HMPREF1120_02406 [Exophiala dermatitidis NIH/UT8656]XP_009154696.1 hypothetical protein, variant [Exophiala dermatitidis NIH/UT8656]EHY54234.1 hypothetical protein, variant [Exophiala dermatitidis NIH/UT8656]EHY54235.1 hypothetical protein HMPREF1120_02406 [Exophiala dermatitidis NIH/UT8656]
MWLRGSSRQGTGIWRRWKPKWKERQASGTTNRPMCDRFKFDSRTTRWFNWIHFCAFFSRRPCTVSPVVQLGRYSTTHPQTQIRGTRIYRLCHHMSLCSIEPPRPERTAARDDESSRLCRSRTILPARCSPTATAMARPWPLSQYRRPTVWFLLGELRHPNAVRIMTSATMI